MRLRHKCLAHLGAVLTLILLWLAACGEQVFALGWLAELLLPDRRPRTLSQTTHLLALRKLSALMHHSSSLQQRCPLRRLDGLVGADVI